jgi:hypothetical protein
VNAALENLADAIAQRRQLPSMVFNSGWQRFMFFDSDWIFEAPFVSFVKNIFSTERSQMACIRNLDASISANSQRDFCICEETLPEHYASFLSGGGDARLNWLHALDRFACASDVGTWAIYCERRNEIAVAGFQATVSSNVAELFSSLLKALPIEEAISRSHIYGLSRDALSDEWAQKLVAEYSGP